ncbi:MAG: HNH endonuclease domain-containing protein [Terrimicrobiaceae bacterium]|nr:HNH endonuclease domain-containing protein [Terrimicrobiaceae bacterium]
MAIRYDAKNQRPYPDSLLASEVTFLMKLKNTLVESEGGQRKLTVEEIQKIFAVVTADALTVPIKAKPRGKKGMPQVLSETDEAANGMRTWPARAAGCYALTAREWANKKGIKELRLSPVKGHDDVKAPKTDGRSRFSRPALRLIRALILEGQKPSEFLRRLQTREPELLKKIGMDVLDAAPLRGKKNDKAAGELARPWILTSHLKFIEDLARTNRKDAGDSWEGLHLPEQRIDALQERHTEDGIVDRDNAIRELLGSINDPVVRHRLGVFAERLRELHGRFAVPEQVVLEFVRTDFMGKRAKEELEAFQRKREKDRANARDRAGKTDALKYELCVAQGCICLYCGQSFQMTELENYEVEHIVPRSQNGPDAMVNYVLAHRQCNDNKSEHTPYEWLRLGGEWDAYAERVSTYATTLRNKKVQLLLREDAPELVQRYTALAETAWISKLAQTVISLHFGWQNGNDAEGTKRVTIVSGGLTGRVRRRYKLNSLLNPPPPGTTDLDEWESTAEKNRADDRHHALDAMVINFLPQWMRDKKKDHFFRFPEAIQKNPRALFQREIDQVMPRNVAYEKAALAKTIYGARRGKEGLEIVQRVPLRELAMKPIAPDKTKFDVDYLRKQIKGVRDAAVAQALIDLLEYEPDEAAWERFCADFRLRRRDGSPGPRVLRISVHVGEPTEYREMSKDGTGAWRKGLGSHQGQIIYWNEKGVLCVRPVFAHGSVARERKAIAALGGQARFYGFFQSDCAVQTTKEIPAENYSLIVKNEAKQKRWVRAEHALPPCRLTLRTIVTKTQFAEMTLANNTRVVAKLDVWASAGLIRVK